MNPSISLIREIDALLPQTQCGLCGHRDGCLPYAKSIAEGEEANKCVPGGQPVADALAQLLNRSLLPAETSVWPVQADGRPQRMKAIIREDECIGCTKCINACPVDAIIGSGKLMHTILTDLCTGCELCIPPALLTVLIWSKTLKHCQANSNALQNKMIYVNVITLIFNVKKTPYSPQRPCCTC